MKIAYFLNFYPIESRHVAEGEILKMQELGHKVYVFPLLGRLASLGAVPEPLKGRLFYPSNKISLRTLLKSFLIFKDKLFRYIIKSRPYLGISHSLFLLEVVDWVRKFNIERIHVHFASNAAIKAMVVSEFTGIPFSCAGHGSELLLYPDKHLSEIIKKAKPFITISNYNRKILIERYGIPEETIKVLYCGVDLKRFQPQPKLTSNETPHILSVTWMRPEKGVRYLVEACRILKDKGLNFKCTIVGGGRDFDNIKKLIAALGLEDVVSLTGTLFHRDIIELYKTADIFCLPSLSEGIPVVVMEAMAMKLPVVSTNITGIPEIVGDGENGFLAEPKDPVALSEKIEYLINHPEKREDVGTKGRKTVEERFNLDKNVKVLEGWLS